MRIFDIPTSHLSNFFGILRIQDVGTEEQLRMSDSGTRRPMRTSSLLSLLGVLLLSSCENNPLDAIDPRGAEPFLQSVTILPKGFDLDTKTSSGGNYTLVTTVVAVVSDPQGASDITDVTYALYDPVGATPIATGKLTKTAPASDSSPVTCNAMLTFYVARQATGIYRLEIQAIDKVGHVSGMLIQELPVYTGRSAPVLSAPGARVLAQSGADSVRYALTVSASDSNGLADIAVVSVRTIGVKNPVTLPMYDDGAPSHADAIAGDGVYSVPAWVSPTGSLLEVAFEFSASDRAAHASNVVRRPVANDPPQFVALNVPATITRPVTGSTLVTFAATVADRNGLSDIDSVCFRNMSATTPVPFLLFDDGDVAAHGDSVANDGSFASILQITASNTPGAKLFKFSVTDRMGGRADSTVTITIN